MNNSRVLILSDTHFPYEKPMYFKWIKKIKAKINPTNIIHIGDLVDFNSLSFWLDWESATLVKRLKKSSKRPLIKGLNENQIKKMLIERNKFYAKSDHRIKCENHKKNEIVDKIVIVLKRNEN